MRRERRKRARVGGEAAPVAQAALVAQAAQVAPTAQGSVCLAVPSPLVDGRSIDPPSWWKYEGSVASVAIAYPIPAAVNDGPPFEAPNGYAPSALVFEELVDFGPCALIRGGSRLDLSPFPSCLAGVRAALTVLLLVHRGVQFYLARALCRRPHYLAPFVGF